MENNNQIITPEPKYRKELNWQQMRVLDLLYTFRFASSEQIAKDGGKKSAKDIQKRLKILGDQGFIAKRYDKSYKLRGKPAAYYLLPKGARLLDGWFDRSSDELINVKAIYKDDCVTEEFINHCLNILNIYLRLELHPGKECRLLMFSTKSNLNNELHDHYPKPLPDGYIYLDEDSWDVEYFLDVFEESQPFFVRVRRIKKYLDYAKSGEWEGERLPTVLMVCENNSTQKRLRKRIAWELRESEEEELLFATTTMQQLLETDNNGAVWLPIDLFGDDEDEPFEPLSLIDLFYYKLDRS